MIKTRGFAAKSAGELLTPFEFLRREPGPTDVLIEIEFCGVCHSDIHSARAEWGAGNFPLVPGHEISGTVVKVGSAVKKFVPGDAAGVGCLVGACQDCSACREGLEQFCERGAVWTYGSMEKDGVTPTYGGYSKQIVVDEKFVLKIPPNTPLDKVAPLLCAGITTYSPLKHWGAGPGKSVAVVGMGGLGHMALKLAVAMGAEVTVLSHSDKKRPDSFKMGAKNFVNTSKQESFENLKAKFDLMINTVSVPLEMSDMMTCLKRGGTFVVLGVPEKSLQIHAFDVISGRKSLAGSLIGGIRETQEMLDFCIERNIFPEIELIPMEKINMAYERMIKGDVRYRFVIDNKTIK